MTQDTHRIQLTTTGQPTPGGFEVIAITAGSGNGWDFPADVLQQSLALWDGAHSFVDHAWFGHSLRDLGGVLYAPEWDAESKGIKAKLKPAGPSGTLLAAIGQEMITEAADATPKPRVGFSADITFSATGRQVKQILKVYSVDLVYEPARGGAFVRALNSVAQSSLLAPHVGQSSLIANPTKGTSMTQPSTPAAPVVAPAGELNTQLQQHASAVDRLLVVQQARNEAAAEVEQMQAVRLQMCKNLLESELTLAKLPKAAADLIRKQFAGKLFEPSDLTDAIDDQRKLVAELTAGQSIVGPAGRMSQMFNTEDQLQAAFDDMLGAPRDEKHEKLSVHKLRGIREAYHLLTGDYDYHGGYYPDRVKLATTADFSGLVKNALNKIVVNQWELMGREGYTWWEQLVPPASESHFESLNQITGTLIGSVGTLPEVAEQGEYTELVVGDSPEVATFKKYGGYIPLTIELIDRDETKKLRAYPRELANASLRRISKLVAAVFTDNAAVGPTMADTGALFNSTAVTTAGGHANLLTTALGTTYAAWEAVAAAIYNQPMLVKNATGYYGTGDKMAIDPRFCLVPRALRGQANDLFLPNRSSLDNKSFENLYKGNVIPVTVPEWTDATDWAAMCSPTIAPSIWVGDRFGRMPEIFVAGNNLSPAVFSNDEHRIKVRQFTVVWVNDFRPIHKSNVA